MSNNKRTIINVVCSMFVLLTNVAISFWLSPYIVEHIGVEANGFVTLANNFVTYAQLIVTALNSMAARFIAIAYVKKDYKKANLYYNSVFWGNLIIVAVLIIPAIVCIAKLESLVNVPNDILLDVKILFSFVFLNFFISTGLPNWDCGTFVTNRLERTYIPQMLTSILRCIIIFTTLTILLPKVYYIGIATIISNILLLICNYYNTRKLTPELKIKLFPDKILYSGKAIKELVGAGIWNSVSNVGNMLLSGLDLIICNVFLGATQMGVISLTKIVPNAIGQLSSSIQNAFAPELTINYAQDNREALLKNLNRAMKLTSIILVVPIAVFIVLGKEFFSLWVPSQDASLLQILSILAIFGYMFTSGTLILFNVFQTVNKVKSNAIAMIISGIFSVVITIIIAKFTDYGIYAVAGVSSICNFIRNMVFTLPATAKYLGFKWNIFYKQVFISFFSTISLIIIGSFVKKILESYFAINSWAGFIFAGAIIAIIDILINIFIILNKDERKYLMNKIKSKLKK